MSLREKINDMVGTNSDKLYSRIYDWLMLLMIGIGIYPLMFRNTNTVFYLWIWCRASVS